MSEATEERAKDGKKLQTNSKTTLSNGNAWLRRRIFHAEQGGFQIRAAWRTNGTRANEFENNAAIREKDQS